MFVYEHLKPQMFKSKLVFLFFFNLKTKRKLLKSVFIHQTFLFKIKLCQNEK